MARVYVEVNASGVVVSESPLPRTGFAGYERPAAAAGMSLVGTYKVVGGALVAHTPARDFFGEAKYWITLSERDSSLVPLWRTSGRGTNPHRKANNTDRWVTALNRALSKAYDDYIQTPNATTLAHLQLMIRLVEFEYGTIGIKVWYNGHNAPVWAGQGTAVWATDHPSSPIETTGIGTTTADGLGYRNVPNTGAVPATYEPFEFTWRDAPT